LSLMKYRLRTKKTEELVDLAQSGLKEALDLLIEKYYPMVLKISSKYFAPWAEFQDMVQNGLVGFIKAVYYYQSDRSGFTSFAWRSIESEIRSFLTFMNRKKNKMLTDAFSVDSSFGENDEEPSYSIQDTSYSTAKTALIDIIMERIEKHLDKSESEIVEMWLSGYSYKEIQEAVQVNFKKVDNTIQKVKRVIKTKVSSNLLRVFFDQRS